MRDRTGADNAFNILATFLPEFEPRQIHFSLSKRNVCYVGNIRVNKRALFRTARSAPLNVAIENEDKYLSV